VRLRGRGSKNADDAEGRCLAECQWKSDARVGWWCKSESEVAHVPGRTCNVQWSRSEELVSASAGRWETASGPVAIENRELAGG
jgi:hypothetical protein